MFSQDIMPEAPRIRNLVTNQQHAQSTESFEKGVICPLTFSSAHSTSEAKDTNTVFLSYISWFSFCRVGW